jgi:large subunit ribosomal protein L3
MFEEGDKVKISGISKAKGFQGGVKRHGFHGKSASHGVKHEHRTIGSVGSMYPQRVIKGKRMPGRMGGDTIAVKNLLVVQIDIENNTLSVKGAVPGRPGTLLFIEGKI